MCKSDQNLYIKIKTINQSSDQNHFGFGKSISIVLNIIIRVSHILLQAINKTIEAISGGTDRVLLVMATGTGKTYTALIANLTGKGAKANAPKPNQKSKPEKTEPKEEPAPADTKLQKPAKNTNEIKKQTATKTEKRFEKIEVFAAYRKAI